MMMVPYFHDALLDDWFNDDWDRAFDRAFRDMSPRQVFGKRSANVMKTDVRETDAGYEVFIDLPGFKKEDIQAHVENGYLTIQASQDSSQETKDKKDQFIRRERYSGQCSRSFYVGEQMTEADIHAKYENGILHLTLPKKEAPALPERRSIPIE